MMDRSIATSSSTSNHESRARAINVVRILITFFILVLLTIVSLGWMWTTSHQTTGQQTASHIVLTVAALAGVFAIARIWRPDRPDPGTK